MFARFVFLFIAASGAIWCDEPKTLHQQIFQNQRKDFIYEGVVQPKKLMIVFSGTPGMGKTTIATQLEEKFQAIRISSDNVRAIMIENGSRNWTWLEDYLLWSLKQVALHSPNKLIILDRSIDRPYPTYIQFAKTFGYELFLIRIQVDKGLLKKRIKERGTTHSSAKTLLKQLNHRWTEYKLSEDNYPADYDFDNNESLDHSMPALIALIEKRI